MESCDECGNHDITVHRLEQAVVEECGLCGHLQGDPDGVQRFRDETEAEEWGVTPDDIVLLRTLESIPGVRVDRAHSTASADRASPPAIFFCPTQHPLAVLDRLTRSLLLACRRTSTLWTVEATHQGRLWFVLRPRLFHYAAEVGDAEAAALRRDVAVLHRGLARDLDLAWWHIGEGEP